MTEFKNKCLRDHNMNATVSPFTAQFSCIHLLFLAQHNVKRLPSIKSSMPNRPTGPSDYKVLNRNQSHPVPSLIQDQHTRDQSLANRDIYTLLKVGRC